MFNFFISNKENKVRFFEERFLLTNVKLDKVFKIFFLMISNIYVDFKAQNNNKDIILP